MLPTFLVIGAAKCGTTSLAAYLGSHPQVFVTRNKEPNYFSQHYDNGLGWYERHFRRAGAAVARGEASTSYTKAPEVPGVPERIAATLPDVRLVYLIRNPVEQIRSSYLFGLHRLSQRPEPIERAVFNDPRYLSVSRYAFQLDRYLEHFPREQLLVVSTERLRDDRRATVEQVLAFLGADPSCPVPGLGVDHNATADLAAPPPVLVRTRRVLLGTRLYTRIPKHVRRRVRSATERPVDPARSQLPPELEQRIWRELAPDLARLREIVGPDFDLWGKA